MQVVIDSFAENAAFAREREPLEEFYSRITERIRKLPDFTAKQRLLVTLYDRFFTKAFPKLADRMGDRLHARRGGGLHPAVCGRRAACRVRSQSRGTAT